MKKILFAAVAAICASCVLSASADDYVRIKSADANSYQWVDTGVNGGTDLAFDTSTPAFSPELPVMRFSEARGAAHTPKEPIRSP